MQDQFRRRTQGSNVNPRAQTRSVFVMACLCHDLSENKLARVHQRSDPRDIGRGRKCADWAQIETKRRRDLFVLIQMLITHRALNVWGSAA